MSENNYLTESALLSESRKAVEISGGRKVLIRRVSPSAFLQATGNIPDLTRLAEGAGAGEKKVDPAVGKTAAAAIEKVLLLGLVQPKLTADPAEGPTPSDFEWPDQLALFNAILEHSNWNKRAAGEVVPFSGTSA